MNLTTIPYKDYEKDLPQNGQIILGQLRRDNIIVYQAFNQEIAEYAVKNQRFGGPAYAFSRMSWIKPNFLWMMYRSGWASKPSQEKILAIEIGLQHFLSIVKQAVYSSFQPDLYTSKETWENALKLSELRLQWDPDHDPNGRKLERRAIQLGLKGETLQSFGNEWIVSIEDITPFVLEQRKNLALNGLNELLVIREQVIL